MKKICIAKKIAHQNVEFLDFAVNDDDQLIVFSDYKQASDFLKSAVGTGEALLDYFLTDVEVQKDNPQMIKILEKGIHLMTPDNTDAPIESTETPSEEQAEEVETISKPENSTEEQKITTDTTVETERSEVECMFLFKGDNYEIINHQKIYDKKLNRTLIPVFAFFDETDSSKPAEVDNFELITIFIDKAETPNG